MSTAAHRPFNSWDALKLLAIALMVFDHIGAFFLNENPTVYAIGRAAAPPFLFLVGYASSHRFRWDLLLLAAAMSVSDFLLTGHLRTQNILVTIILIRLIFNWHDRRGRLIERPYEWYFASVALVVTLAVTQYGSFGLLFALCGYLNRRPEQYDEKLRRRFWLLTYISYAILIQISTQFTPLNALLMTLSLTAIATLLWRFRIYDIPPHPLLGIGKWIAVWSGYLYAFHLIALEWLTGRPF